MVDNSEFAWDGPALENYDSLEYPMTVCWTKRHIFWFEKTNKKGWHHHTTSPFLVYKISNSNPILLKKSHPPHGSQTMEMGRIWIQHCLQTMNNLVFLWIWRSWFFLTTWWVPDKGKGGKSPVALWPQNHGTIAIQNHDTIQSWLHEPCGCWESNDSLKRIGKANQGLNAGTMQSDLQGSDPLRVMS